MKVNEIAEKLGVSRQFIQQVVAGKRKMPQAKEQAIDKLIVNLRDINGDGATIAGMVRDGSGIYVPEADVVKRIEALETDVAILKRLLVRDDHGLR